MSKLETLARKRALERQASATPSSSDISSASISASNSSSSLLDRLKNKKKTPTIETSSMTLAEKLKLKKQSPAYSPTLHEVKRDSTSSHESKPSVLQKTLPNAPSVNSLSSKLMALRKQGRSDSSIPSGLSSLQRPETLPPESATESKQIKIKESEELLSIKAEVQKFKLLLEERANIAKRQHRPSKYKIELITSRSYTSKAQHDNENELKRNSDNVFGVFHPRSKKNKIAENFKKPSPDDIILMAQEKAFDEINDKVSKLNVIDDITQVVQFKQVQIPTEPIVSVNMMEYLRKYNPRLNVIMCGHSKSGKSTILGRILHDLRCISIEKIRDLKRQIEKRDPLADSNLYLSWITNTSDDERRLSKTLHVHKKEFNISDKHTFRMVDIPSDRKFSSSVIPYLWNSDVAILVIDCSIDGFEIGFSLDGQTLEHAKMIKSEPHIKNVIILMNKMDTIDWYETRYIEIKNELIAFLLNIGFQGDQLSWIPCDGTTGHGITQQNSSITWYNGPILLDVLKSFSDSTLDQIKSRIIDDELVLQISQTELSKQLIYGNILSGSIQPGETITIYPSRQSVTISKIMSLKEEKLVQRRISTVGESVVLKILNGDKLNGVIVGDYVSGVTKKVSVLGVTGIFRLKMFDNLDLAVGSRMVMIKGFFDRKVKILKKVDKFTFEVELIDKTHCSMPFFPEEDDKLDLNNVILLQNNRIMGSAKLIE
ncbi:hypothetical protein KAFR_0D02380 [Kazachstania africana CBS 2517]|uniref:Tr-type G domain-containing protein n=1 Tax=Kazachstania africana (strain ATCC 22294 / BCRC 22015 / CBS 2517 / CECT 1963 / NBRC 1671 / NRRL Y-8276) TaxID=1071382 RepID=H2AU35_KAZAF|nr:hypothetical protein KAFR_0D02380 [Kazachstania africana CBS 2517]CCF57885.1 hypothetical protein KAFR_0D02380 [Kazachstania africana CBS 2517]